ncbi:MAG: magnesium transporter [Candidatus Sumerlaeia bacterium]|nr:magnesium transporter [Candidatus Sumerlaeia bacterium]
MPMLGHLLLPEIQELVEQRNYRLLKETLLEIPAADLADMVEDLEQSEFVVVFRLLPKHLATDVFEYLELEHQKMLLEQLRGHRVQELMKDMSPDDRTALLEELPTKAANRLMMMLPREERDVARTLLNYPEESVGRVMTPDFVYLLPTMTVADALTKIRILGINRETVYDLYVVDDNMAILGYVSLANLVTASLEVAIRDLMAENVITISAMKDQEEAVDMLSRYDLAALPVVDLDERLIGIVTFDDILDIVEEEYTEDVHLQAAVQPLESSYLKIDALSLVKSRVPWLIILLVAETLGVFLLRRYDDFLEATIALALFLPVMIATGGNTGTQSAALVIRAMATGDLRLKDGFTVLARELLVSALLSSILGIISFGLVLGMEGDFGIALCIGVGLATIVTLSNLMGVMLPLLLQALRYDPALMSGPFISTVIDVVGLVIYLEISRYILLHVLV